MENNTDKQYVNIRINAFRFGFMAGLGASLAFLVVALLPLFLLFTAVTGAGLLGGGNNEAPTQENWDDINP